MAGHGVVAMKLTSGERKRIYASGRFSILSPNHLLKCGVCGAQTGRIWVESSAMKVWDAVWLCDDCALIASRVGP